MKHLQTFESFLNEREVSEKYSQSFIPDNITNFAHESGPWAVKLLKKAISWADKANKHIVGGELIGGRGYSGGYGTIYLDVFQKNGHEIKLDLKTQTIFVYGEEAKTFSRFTELLAKDRPTDWFY